MFDSHIYQEKWGIMPYLTIGETQIATYGFMILLGIISGIVLLKVLNRNQEDRFHDDGVLIVASALLFGTLGAKIPIWIMNWKSIIGPPFSLELLMSGRTIVGGFLGGLLGVMFVKRRLGIKGRHGNKLVAPVALGMIFGRLGCFFRGCCFGEVTQNTWGIDFGDHLLRHPTQLYEVVFHFTAFLFLLRIGAHKEEGGKWISRYFMGYLLYRFFTEFIRIHEVVAFGLTSYQWACLIGIAFIALKEKKFNKKANQTHF